MITIQSILNKTASMANRTGQFSIQKGEFFDTLTDITNKVKEVNDNVNSVAKSLIWQSPVATFADLATTYPAAVQGWAAMVTSLGYVYSYNGSAWKDTGLKAFPEDVAVKSEFFDINISKNIFDKSSVTPGTYINTANGALINEPAFLTSDFIPVDSNSKYISNYDFSFICFYNSSKNLISGITAAGQTAINTPENCMFIRLSTGYNKDIVQVEKGNVSTEYTTYFFESIPKFETTGNKINNWSEIPSTEKTPTEFLISDIRTIVESSFSISKNIFDKSSVTPGTYINTANGALINELAFLTSDFIPVDANSKYISNYDFSFICFYNSSKNLISGITAAGQTAINTPENCMFIRLSTGYNKDIVQVEKGNVSTEYTAYKIITLKKQFTPILIDITATRNNADYNSIREIIESISDASEGKIYRIHVPNGRWFECDLKGKKYVEIIGQDKYLTVLFCDGTSNKLTPSNYSAGASGVALSTIPQYNKHCINISSDLRLANISVEANDVKYCIHIDNPYYKNVELINCHFLAKANVNNCIGIGINGGQSIKMFNCDFARLDNGMAIFVHNWNNQTKPASVSVKNSFFKNCHYILVDELGSEQDDLIELINCSSNIEGNVIWMVDYNSEFKTYWINPITSQKEPNPQNVPYCIKLNVSATIVSNMYSESFPNEPYLIARPLFQDYVIGELFKYHFSKTTVVPANSQSPGNKGEVRIIDSVEFICIEKNTWKRNILSDF